MELALAAFSLNSLVQIILVLVVIGVVLYLINTYLPIHPAIKTVIIAIVVIALCLWLLSFAGIVR